MRLKIAQRKSRRGRSLFLTFLLLLSIPVFVIGLLQDESFDIRNRAFDDIEVSEENPCVITFPNVNPYSLEINSTFRVQIDAVTTSLGVQAISIKDENNNDLFSKTYETNPQRISESFFFTPTVEKAYEIKGIMLDFNKKSYECVVSSTHDVEGVRAVSNNSKPVFTSSPKSSKPSQSIRTGDIYEYKLVAEDLDKDTINYSFSFTPGNLWLKPTVIEDGGNGRLTIKFRGSTEQPASYLANVFIHDGYSRHLSSQSWVISVSPKENDIPSVKIINPYEPILIKEQNILKVRWDSRDINHISKFEMYVSSNPTNEKSWITINRNIPYNATTQDINTTELKDGTYRIILRAIDNQNPPAIGMDISEEIVISKGQTEGKEPDDQVALEEPQIINFSPTSTDDISNNRPTIKASLIASVGESVIQESILVKLDNIDITKKIKINKISDSEYTVLYLPEEELSKGVHKVEITFKDSAEKEVSKDWTFTISGEEVDPDSFNIFGYFINKRVAMIIGGGIALLILAIFTPMIIFAVWKDDSVEKSDFNPTLPPTIPREEGKIETPAYEKPNQITELVTENFTAPKPIIEDTPAQKDIPEPVADLSILLEQINDAQKEQKKENTPSKPIL